MSNGRIIAVCTSKKKGMPKKDVGEGFLRDGFGLDGDAHGGDRHRQVSLLAIEQIRTMEEKGIHVEPGGFAENLTTEGLDLDSVTVGHRFTVGEEAVLEITQIGKECHTRCAIYHKVGECIMPQKGVFARVVTGGTVKRGDPIETA